MEDRRSAARRKWEKTRTLHTTNKGDKIDRSDNLLPISPINDVRETDDQVRLVMFDIVFRNTYYHNNRPHTTKVDQNNSFQ